MTRDMSQEVAEDNKCEETQPRCTASVISIEGPATPHLTNNKEQLLSKAWSLSSGNLIEIVIHLVHHKYRLGLKPLLHLISNYETTYVFNSNNKTSRLGEH